MLVNHMKLFLANWKMQLSPAQSLLLAKSLVRVCKDFKGTAVLCPDFLSLTNVAKVLKNSPLLLGAQDAAAVERGAYTGEVSAADLKSVGVKYVLIGHSERRSHLQEDDKLLAAKITAVIEQQLIPVLCVGENAADRKQGRAASVIKAQLKGALQHLSATQARTLVVAYEPVWAIGTGINCDFDNAQRSLTVITDWCRRAGLKRPTVLYGGSVKLENARDFLGVDGFDGLLVGGASLEAKSFKKIVNA